MKPNTAYVEKATTIISMQALILQFVSFPHGQCPTQARRYDLPDGAVWAPPRFLAEQLAQGRKGDPLSQTNNT